MRTKTIRNTASAAGGSLTLHAQQRIAQRGIRQAQIDLINLFGVDHLQKGGAMLCFIPDRTIAELRAALDRCSGVALVKGEGDAVVTAFHQNRKISHTEWAA
jgi:hypothetical protein